MPARLPTKYYQRSLSRLPIGATGYTVPWAMRVDERGECWLKADYPYDNTSHGTMCMMVENTSRGFVVTIPVDYGHQWEREVVKSGIPVVEVR